MSAIYGILISESINLLVRHVLWVDFVCAELHSGITSANEENTSIVIITGKLKWTKVGGTIHIGPFRHATGVTNDSGVNPLWI